MPAVRIELGDGDYGLVYQEMRHKTDRLMQANLRKYFKPLGKPFLLSELTPETKLTGDYEIDAMRFDQAEQDHILLINQLSELRLEGQSYKHPPEMAQNMGQVYLTDDTFDLLSKRKYETLLAEVNKLYGLLPLPEKPPATSPGATG